MAPVKKWLDAVTGKDLAKGAAIVALTGLFAGGAAYSTASKMEIPIEGMGNTLQIVVAISALVMTLLGWILTSLIYHASAHLLGGKGDRNRMFALTGYASIPALIQQLLRFVSYWFLGQTAMSATTPLEVLLEYFNVFSVIGLVLVGVAVMLNYGISGRKAAFVALIPTILSLCLAVYSLWSLRAAATATRSGLFSFSRGG